MRRNRRLVEGRFVEGSGDEVDDREAQRASHQAGAATVAVDDECRDNGTDDSDSVEAASESVLLDGRVAGLRKEDRRVAKRRERESAPAVFV